MRPRVILADDHVMVAEGLGHVIGRVADLVETVASGLQLVESVRRERPDIVVSDITMPGMSGLDAMRQLQSEHISVRFIFLTIHTEPRLAAEAMRAGARGYLLKQAAGEELLEAIRAVMAGRTYLTPLISADTLWAVAQGSHGLRALTPRQLDVLRLIGHGKRMKEIAAELGLSVRTVEDHKAHLLDALGAESTADLVKFAVKQGLVPE
jgi:two-component system, NarL family, response regulator NreC